MVTKRVRVFAMFMMVCLLSILCVDSQAEATARPMKARNAYKEFLSKKSYQWGNAKKAKHYKFSIVDVNGDKVEELVVENEKACYADGYIKIFAYVGNRVKHIATGHSDFYIYKSTGIIRFDEAHTGSYMTQHLKWNGKKLKVAAKCEGTDMQSYADEAKHTEVLWDDYKVHYISYKLGKKEVSYKKYKKKVDKYEKDGAVKLVWTKNTKKNREKIFG